MMHVVGTQAQTVPSCLVSLLNTAITMTHGAPGDTFQLILSRDLIPRPRTDIGWINISVPIVLIQELLRCDKPNAFVKLQSKD